jgi:hypothetical protein
MSYHKMKKAELIEELERRDAQRTQAGPANVEGQIFDVVKARYNAHGKLFNCRFAPEVQSIPSLKSMGDELQTELRARNEPRVDRHGRIWVDLYPKSENVFEQAEQNEAPEQTEVPA